MGSLRIVDVTDADSFGLLPPCADPGFDHRTCDYWEDADRGSKAARASWLETAVAAPGPTRRSTPNPFAPERASDPNPFAPPGRGSSSNPFAPDDAADPLAGNPFAPVRDAGPGRVVEGPRKLQLLTRGLAIFGSYAKVLFDGDRAVAYAQFGPLSAYPRASRTRQLYPSLPATPLPAVISCIATVADARGLGHGRRLVEAVCDDLAARGFAAIETYPTVGAEPDATSAASPAFWEGCGFRVAAADDRYPVMRRELT